MLYTLFSINLTFTHMSSLLVHHMPFFCFLSIPHYRFL